MTLITSLIEQAERCLPNLAGHHRCPVPPAGGTVQAVDDRSCRLRMSVDAFDWPVLILAAMGAEFDVEEPPEFRDYVRTVGRLFQRGSRPH